MDKVTSMRIHRSTIHRLKALKIVEQEPLESVIIRLLDNKENSSRN